MATPTLFNLDPTQFSLGRSTGRIQQLVGNPTQQNAAELGKLLSALTPVTAEKPVAPDTWPTVTLVNPQLQTNADAAYRTYQSWQQQVNNLASANLTELGKQTLRTREANRDSALNQYNSIKATLDAENARYQKEQAEYDRVVVPFKQKSEAYVADVNRYASEFENTRNKFQSDYLNQDVNQDPILSEGETLAASSLYSDTLHQQMLEKIAEANAEPASDSLTSLYSR